MTTQVHQDLDALLLRACQPRKGPATHEVDLIAWRLIAVQFLKVLICRAPASFSSGQQSRLTSRGAARSTGNCVNYMCTTGRPMDCHVRLSQGAARLGSPRSPSLLRNASFANRRISMSPPGGPS